MISFWEGEEGSDGLCPQTPLKGICIFRQLSLTVFFFIIHNTLSQCMYITTSMPQCVCVLYKAKVGLILGRKNLAGGDPRVFPSV